MSNAKSASPTFRIVLEEQHVIPLCELGAHAPRRRGGRKIHRATAYRWALSGARARDGSTVVLPTIRVAGTKCTSIEAFQWFCDQLTAPAAAAGLVPESRAEVARRRALEAIDHELDELGL
jgi:hypothetical protein